MKFSIKKFRNYSLNEEYKFYEQMDNNYKLLKIAYKELINLLDTIEFGKHDDDRGDTEDNIAEAFSENIKFDGTELLSLNIEEELDLCIYAEGSGAVRDLSELKIKWSDLESTISENAVWAFAFEYFRSAIWGFCKNLGEFIDKNELKLENISTTNKHGKEISRNKITGGEELEYGNIEDTTLYKKVYVFNYKLNDIDEFSIKLYIYSEEDVAKRFGL